MDKVFTEQPILDAGIRSVNFFNGRLLTAEDLTAEQTANVQARRLLAKALGDGVAEGLFVSISGKPEDYLLSVDAGIAVSRRGDVLQLASPTSVSMTGSLKSPADQVATIFSDCDTTPSGQFTPTGLYLLTVSPAASGEGRAPTSGLGNSGSAACNTRYVVQGVVFHLIRLSAPAITNQLRNILAYQSFGFLPLSGALLSSASPLTTALETPPLSSALGTSTSLSATGYGLLDALPADKYPVCNVPLALIFTTPAGISFVDNWSVRRQVTPRTATQPWQVFRSPRRASEAEAMFLQFQEQLGSLVQAQQLTSASRAVERFKLLPPAGILPGITNKFDWRTFLGVHAPAYATRIDSGLLTSILAEALSSSPFVVEDSDQPPAALDVYAIPAHNPQWVREVDAALAGQIDLVSRTALLSALKLSEPGAGFVLYARGRRGRIRLSFTSHEFNDTQASFDARVTDSNLEVRASPTPSGDYVFPDLDQGFYLAQGAILGYKPIPTRVVEVVGGQVTQVQLSPVPLALRLCLVFEGLERLKLQNVRLCLVEGTFEAAIALSADQPWAGFIPLEPNDPAAEQQMLDWQDVLNSRYPGVGFDADKPQLYFTEQIGANLDVVSKRLGAPESPLVYVVFGKLGIPLTFLKDTNIRRNPIPLTAEATRGNMVGLKNIIGGIENIGTSTLLTSKIIRLLNRYGVLYVDQLAGAWIDLVTEAAPVSAIQAALLIKEANSYLAQVDKLEGGFNIK